MLIIILLYYHPILIIFINNQFYLFTIIWFCIVQPNRQPFPNYPVEPNTWASPIPKCFCSPWFPKTICFVCHSSKCLVLLNSLKTLEFCLLLFSESLGSSVHVRFGSGSVPHRICLYLFCLLFLFLFCFLFSLLFLFLGSYCGIILYLSLVMTILITSSSYFNYDWYSLD